MGGPQYRPQNTIVLLVGTPKKGTPNFGKPPFGGKHSISDSGVSCNACDPPVGEEDPDPISSSLDEPDEAEVRDSELGLHAIK